MSTQRLSKSVLRRKKYKQIVQQKLNNKKLELVGEYTTTIDKHEVKCKICNYTWHPSLNTIVNSGTGCPCCAGLIKLTNELVDSRLLEKTNKIYRIGNITNARTKCTWGCECGNEWKTTPDSILNAGTSCPVCNKRGLYDATFIENNPHLAKEPANLYFIRLIEKKDSSISFLKVGITKNQVDKRLSPYKSTYDIDVLYNRQLKLSECIKIEHTLLQNLQEYKFIPCGRFGGRTECFIDTPKAKSSIIRLLE